MPTHFCVSLETAEEFMRLFVNRLAYGIQRQKPLPDGTCPISNRPVLWTWVR